MTRLLITAAAVLLLCVPNALARSANTVTITGGPSNTVNTKDASFTFSATGDITNFRCSLDGGAPSACTSPTTYSGLGDGGHTFALQGFRSSTGPLASTTRTWTIDTSAPETTITTPVPAASKSTTIAFEFAASEQAHFRCRLDGGPWTDCAPPMSLTGLAQGSHVFEVAAADPAGNVDASPATAGWQVDTGPPDTSLTYPTKPYSQQSSIGFALEATEPGSTFQCRLDVGAYAPCAAHTGYQGLSEGQHTFQAYATDSAGNSDPTPVVRTWIVDKTLPVASIVLPKEWMQLSTSFTVSWKATETHSGVAGYQIRHRKATPVTSFPKAGLLSPMFAYVTGNWTTIVGKSFPSAEGMTRCLSVRARDKAGNVGGWSKDACTAIPVDDKQLSLGPVAKWWETKTGAGYFQGTYSRLKAPMHAACLTSHACPVGISITLKPWSRAALVVATCPSCGKLRVSTKSGWSYSFGPIVNLTSSTTVKKKIVPIATTESKPLTLSVKMSGRPRIDGLVISRASVPGPSRAAQP